jgi:dTDP-4-dehydrorhamnose 3,5-epimerase
LQLHTPTIWTRSVASAYEAACGLSEPIFVPAAVHADDRGWSIMNQLQGVLSPQGQINYSVAYPGVVKAWHRHQHQSDFWLCLHGHIKVGIQREGDGRVWQLVAGERRAGVLIIPPTLWHGMATVGHEPAGLLYYVTRAYDPQAPDEDRRPFDALPEFPWTVVHR